MGGERTIHPGQRVQYWLAELDRYDNPKLCDGAHSDEQGAHRALYLLQRMGFAEGKRFAVARVELIDAVPNATGVNEEALETITEALAQYREGVTP